jgi:N-hydroxyarylamine O-acetyltransferase
MDKEKLGKYLERIHYSREMQAGIKVLRQIHQLHPKYIPFENIDPYTGKVPSLDLNDIFEKLVVQSRGGYCYEQNLLLHDVLKTIGFNTELQLARVLWRRDENSKTGRTHLLQTVSIEKQIYLVDCGFGIVTLTAPILLNEEKPQQTPNGLFKISKKDDGYILWFWKENWLPVYRFVLGNVETADLEIANWYLSAHPESNFKKNLILSKVDENARYTYSDHTLNIRYNNGEKESVNIDNDSQLFDILNITFGLKENAAALLRQKTNES